jgi:hypothetical protein
MRRFFILALLAAFAIPQAAQAQSANIIAGFETWASSGGLPGAASFTGTGTGTYTSSNGSISSQAANTDGTFGSSTLATADATTESNGDGSRLTNGADHTYTFTFTDTSGTDTDLDSFHFDLGTFRPNSARTWTLSVDAGGSITAAAAFATGTIDVGTGGTADFFDIDVDLTSLADSTLDANGTAIFTLELSGGVAGAGGHHALLDNVAISSVPVVQGPIIAGFENWVGSAGLPAAASFENTGTGTYDSSNGSIDASAASADGTFGSNTINAADATGESNGDGARLTNGASHTYTFTFTDTSGSDTDLGYFHFDFGTFRPNSARTWTLSTLAGGSISESAAFATGSIGAGTGGEVDFFDIDVSLAGLSDSTLDANGTAIFLLELSGGTVGAGGHHALLDNVAISAAGEVTTVLLGDVDLSGTVDFLDITPFIGVLSGSGIPNQAEADCDESGTVDFLDITPFIAILSGSGS